MADNSDLFGLAQQLAYLRAGGKPQGERDLDKFNNITDTVNKTIGDVYALKKAQLENTKTKVETENLKTTMAKNQQDTAKAKIESTPISDSLVTPQVNSILQSSQEAPVPLEDLISGHFDTRQKGIDAAHELALKGQAEYGNMTPEQYGKVAQGESQKAVAGLRTAQTGQITGRVFVNSKTGQQSVDPKEGFDLYLNQKDADAYGSKLGVQKAKNEGQGDLSPEAIDLLARRYLAGAQDAMGLGAKIRVPVFKRAAEIAAENGDSAGEGMARQAAFKADKSELARIQQQRGVVMSFETTAKINLDRFLQTATKIPDTDTPLLNVPLRELADRASGDPTIAAFRTAGLVAQTEIAKVLQGGMGALLTNEARNEAQKALNPAGATLNQIKASAAILIQDMDARKVGYDTQISETLDRIKGYSNFGKPGKKSVQSVKAPAAETPPPAQTGEEPPGPAKALIRKKQPGEITTFENGQQWTYEGDKFKRVK